MSFAANLDDNKSKNNIMMKEESYFCTKCGQRNPIRFLFCPMCGTKRFDSSKRTSIPDSFSYEKKNSQMEEMITKYLRDINKLHLAETKFQVNIQLESGKKVGVILFGRQNSNDALKALRENGLLSYEEMYEFTDWPNACSCIGPDYHHRSACVCELSPKGIYHVRRITIEDMRELYGCPNSKSIIANNVLDQVRVEIVDYGKK